MKSINNIKKIREIYGATQDDIAKVVGVNRSTISQWETSSSKASNTKLEKLSIYYGIGPEYFYNKEIDEVSKDMVIESSKKEKEIIENSRIERNKANELAKMLEDITFKEARSKFMFAMKILLATADYAELDDLEVAYQITEKMAKRLKAFIDIRRIEENDKKENDQATLYDLIDNNF